MSEDKQLKERLHKISALLQELEAMSDSKCRSSALEIVRTLMDVHSVALERILERTFQAGEVGQRVIDDLGADPIVAGLLVLYGLHPEPFESRVEKVLERAELRAQGIEAQLVSIEGSTVRVRLKAGARTCNSTLAKAKAVLEDAIYEAAPEVESLQVEDGASVGAGFVPLQALAGAGQGSDCDSGAGKTLLTTHR